MTNEEKIQQQREWLDPKKRQEYLRRANSPFVHHCLSLYERGDLSYQAAIELALCHLVHQNKEQFDMLCDLMAKLPPQYPTRIESLSFEQE